MVTKQFLDKYAEYYDLFYSDKDYEKECDFLEEIFRAYNAQPKKILDMGCGTGNHAIPLAKRGYEISGIDASESMISRARKKANQAGVNIAFYVQKMQDVNVNEKFDAAICMFAALNYVTSTDDLLRALKAINRHLQPGSLFIFDFWYGPAVLSIKPSVRTKTIEHDGKKLIRTVTPEMDVNRHVCKTHYSCSVFKDGNIIDQFNETHEVRYFFPLEIQHYLEDAGFELLKLCNFMELGKEPGEATWNVTAIARIIQSK